MAVSVTIKPKDGDDFAVADLPGEAPFPDGAAECGDPRAGATGAEEDAPEPVVVELECVVGVDAGDGCVALADDADAGAKVPGCSTAAVRSWAVSPMYMG